MIKDFLKKKNSQHASIYATAIKTNRKSQKKIMEIWEILVGYVSTHKLINICRLR